MGPSPQLKCGKMILHPRNACHLELRHDMTRPPATSKVTPVPKGLPLIDIQGPLPVLAGFWRAAFGSNPDLPSATVPDYQATLDAAAAGTGLAVVPECLCADMLQTGQLISQNIRAKSQVSIYVARSKGNIAVDRVRISHQLLADAARGW